MPNDCQNVLRIVTQTKNEMLAIVNRMFSKRTDGGNYFDLNNIVPEPETKEECPANCLVAEKPGIEILGDRPWFNWFVWHCQYWGTKWNTYDNNYSDDELKGFVEDCQLNIFFSTAWSPIETVIAKLCDMYPQAEIQYAYYECGCEFAGEYTSEDGSWSADFDTNDKSFRQWTIDWGFESEDYWEERDEEDWFNNNIDDLEIDTVEKDKSYPGDGYYKVYVVSFKDTDKALKAYINDRNEISLTDPWCDLPEAMSEQILKMVTGEDCQ